MTFTEALKAGQTKYGEPDKVVTTHISNVFIFGEKVLKVYKQENFFFADLLTFESRKAFYEEDFFWNNTASPEVYLNLWGVRTVEGQYMFVSSEQGEDFVIEMSKIDDSKTLTKILLNGELTDTLAVDFIDSQVDTLATLTRERRQKLNHLFQRGLLEIMKDNTQSLFDWMLTEPKVSREDAETVKTLLMEGLEREIYFKSFSISDLSAAFDNNCDNLIVVNDKPSFIDILSPMEVWRVVDEYATISRTIVDIEVLQGEQVGLIARNTYSKYGRNIPKVAMLMHELRAAAIQWPYRYMIKQDDLAIKFGVYTKNKMQELKNEMNK
jgi:aminoglycoside phosphotransferase family enzyme